MLEGAIDPKAIAKLAKERGFPAIAICDRNGLYGAVAVRRRLLREGRAADRRHAARRVRAATAARRSTTCRSTRRTRRAGRTSATWSAARTSTARWSCRRMSARPISTGRTEGLIALTGAGEGALTRLLADGQATRPRRCCDRLAGAVPRTGSISSSRARGDRGRGRRRGGADRARLCARPAAGRDQPGQLRRPALPRRARCDAVHRPFDPHRRRRAPALQPRGLRQVGADDGGAVRRPARGDSPTRWWSRSAAPSPRPSASRSCPASPATWKARRGCWPRMRAPGWPRGWRRTAS